MIGAMVCLLAAPWVQLSVSAGNGWPHNALRHHWLMPINCHFRDCKAPLVTSLTHVSGAITSVQTFTFKTIKKRATSVHTVFRSDILFARYFHYALYSSSYKCTHCLYALFKQGMNLIAVNSSVVFEVK